jgi:hypothetical protein
MTPQLSAPEVNECDFPEDQGLEARMRCVVSGIFAGLTGLEHLRVYVLDRMPKGELRDLMTDTIEEALGKVRLAQQAIDG